MPTIKEWIQENIIGDRGSGYAPDYSQGKENDLDPTKWDIPSLPDVIPPGSPLYTYLYNLTTGVLSGVATGVIIQTLRKLIESESKSPQNQAKKS